MNFPLVYLDQNIVSLQASGKRDFSKKEGLQWVYSPEHFSEIKRSPEPERYLSALDVLSAKLLYPNVRICEGREWACLINRGSAHQHYEDYLRETSEVQFDGAIYDPLTAFFNGGSDAERLRAMPAANEKQLESLVRTLPVDMAPVIPDNFTSDLLRTIEQFIEHGNDIERNRSLLGVGKGAASNLRGNNVLLQLWDMVKSGLEAQSRASVTIGQFFGFEPYSFEERSSISMYEGIVRCCSVLDMLGFHAEKKIRILEKIPNIRSDGAHIAAAAYCSAFVSNDRRLVKRAEAIYEYRGIDTEVIQGERI